MPLFSPGEPSSLIDISSISLDCKQSSRKRDSRELIRVTSDEPQYDPPTALQKPGDNRAFHGTTCQAALSREEYPPALPQLVAIDDCALSARHVVEDTALDKHVYARVAE